jgi:mannose-1-phosphate guanylyltransferase
MDAIVLVGGEGTRLRPLTYQIPKQMLPVVDRPLVVHVVEWLALHGVKRAVLSLGYRPEAFLRAFPSGSVAGVEMSYAVEPEPLDTAGAVRFAATAAGVSGTFLAMNGDILTDFDLSALIRLHRARSAEASIHLVPVPDPAAYGVVPIADDGRVIEFIEKPASTEAPTNLINAGTYVLEPSVLERIPPGRRVSIERETFPALAAAGALYGLASDTYWLDTGTPENYLRAQLDILSGKRSELAVPTAPRLRPGVWASASAKLGGKVGPHSYVGCEAVLAEGSVTEDAVIGDRCRVAADVVVRRSVLMSGVTVGRGAVVEDSVLGPGVAIGAGAKLCGMTLVGAGAKVPADSVLAGARILGA